MAHLRHVPAPTLEAAKAIGAAAEEFALQRGWPVAIAVVDSGGGLILFHCLDGTQSASRDICLQKARTAAGLRRPTKVLEDAVMAGRTGLLSVDGVTSLEGGLPIEAGGQVVGAIGVSGVASSEDAQVAQAGLAAFQAD